MLTYIPRSSSGTLYTSSAYFFPLIGRSNQLFNDHHFRQYLCGPPARAWLQLREDSFGRRILSITFKNGLLLRLNDTHLQTLFNLQQAACPAAYDDNAMMWRIVGAVLALLTASAIYFVNLVYKKRSELDGLVGFCSLRCS